MKFIEEGPYIRVLLEPEDHLYIAEIRREQLARLLNEPIHAGVSQQAEETVSETVK